MYINIFKYIFTWRVRRRLCCCPQAMAGAKSRLHPASAECRSWSCARALLWHRACQPLKQTAKEKTRNISRVNPNPTEKNNSWMSVVVMCSRTPLASSFPAFRADCAKKKIKRLMTSQSFFFTDIQKVAKLSRCRFFY